MRTPVPIVVNGASIWGTRNIKQAEQYMQENGLRPLAGINADYFSFKTGIPMGYTIADGENYNQRNTADRTRSVSEVTERVL